MANIILREKATKLRLEGKTYGQIRRELNISKSTLSEWLRNLPLSSSQLALLVQNRELSRDLRIEKFRRTAANKRLIRLKSVFKTQYDKLLPLSEKELYIAGLFLYWGEGEKSHGRFSITNTDPKVIKFALTWMIIALKIPKSVIKIRLHTYLDTDSDEVINFWSNYLDVPKSQFRGPYIKKTNREGLTYKSFGKGTCQLYTHQTVLSEKVAMSIKAISDFYGEKNDIFWYN